MGTGLMNKKNVVWLVVAVQVATLFVAEAQQPAKIPRIGYVSATATRPILDPLSTDSDKGSKISVISRERISWLSIATTRETSTGFQAS